MGVRVIPQKDAWIGTFATTEVIAQWGAVGESYKRMRVVVAAAANTDAPDLEGSIDGEVWFKIKDLTATAAIGATNYGVATIDPTNDEGCWAQYRLRALGASITTTAVTIAYIE